MAELYVSENWNEYQEKRLIKEYCKTIFKLFVDTDADQLEEETKTIGEMMKKAFSPLGFTIGIDGLRINIRRNSAAVGGSRLVAVIINDVL